MLKDRLKIARKNRALTQDELAKKVNTQKTTISNYETGYSTPSNEMLIDLARALNVSTDYLLGLSDIEDPNFDADTKANDDIKKLMEDPDFMLAYHKYPGSPDEAKKDLIGFLNLINEREERKKKK